MKNVTLRLKTLLILGSVFAISYLSISFVSQNVFLLSFAKLEQNQTLQSLKQVETELLTQVDLIDALCRDWARWDDTYRFAQEPNEAYIRSNLTEETFSNLNFDLIGIFDNEKNPLYLTSHDLGENRLQSFPEWLVSYFRENPSLLTHEDILGGHMGIVLLPGTAMLLSSRPILTSEHEGPIRGTFIFGRYLSHSALRNISEKTGIHLDAKRLDGSSSPSDEALAQACLANADKTYVERLSDNDVIVYKVLPTTSEEPGLLLAAKLRRSIFQQGLETIKTFQILLLGIGGVFGLVIIVLLETQVISPVLSLTRAVSQIGNNPTKLTHVPVNGPLEVVRLSETINFMLNSMSLFQADLQKKQKELESKNHELIAQIAERHKAEADKQDLEGRLSQAQKMEAIGTLAGGIAHDFNNILGVILGYAELARIDAPADSELAKALKRITEAGCRAKELVQQILAFSRQEDVAHFPLRLGSIIKKTLKMLRSSIPTTIDIQQEIDSEIGAVLANPTQIHQILMNLGTNAYHAMEETGGILKISLKQVTLDPNSDPQLSDLNAGDYVELMFADTGSGIQPDVIDKIFDPYFTTKEQGKGTGMGLSIIHGIINTNGGAITVQSEPGHGTTFHVYFPVVTQEETERPKEVEVIPGGNEKILLVDDDQLVVEIGKSLLERLGYYVSISTSSLEALATFQESPNDFDLVITDQTMPGMTGSELAERLLQIRPTLPVILCTGYSNLIDEEKAKALGIRGFVTKPVSQTTLAKLIRQVLDVA